MYLVLLLADIFFNQTLYVHYGLHVYMDTPPVLLSVSPEAVIKMCRSSQ